MSDTPKLTRVHRLDSIALDKTYFTSEGYLVDEPIVTSVGIFEYKNPDGSVRKELRLPEHVFAPESLATYEGKPVIVTHDAGRVDKGNVEREIVGTILSPGYQDGDDVRAKIIIHGIDEVQRSGLRELSLGYDLVLDETPGTWKGQPYDAIQTEIKINHLALVGDARAGDQARLNIDGKTQTLKGVRSMKKNTGKAMGGEELKKTIAAYNERRQRRLDEAEKKEGEETAAADSGFIPGGNETPMETPGEDAPTSQDKVKMVKDRRDRRDQEGPPETPEAAMGTIAQQDEDIATLLDIIEQMEAKSDFDAAAKQDADNADCDGGANKDDAADAADSEDAPKSNADSADRVDAIVRERIKLGRLGDRLNLDGLEDMNPIEAKKAVVKKVMPSMRLDGKSKTYINAAFDLAVSQMDDTTKDVNYQRRQMMGRMDSANPPTGKTGAERARERMIQRQMNGGNE